MEFKLIDIDSFYHPSGGTGRNVITFGVDMSSTTKINNRKKDILILRTYKCFQLMLLKIVKKHFV